MENFKAFGVALSLLAVVLVLGGGQQLPFNL